jgi:hypothetical protein
MIQHFNFNKEKLKRFKKAYEDNKNEDTFDFEGYQILPSYAKHMINFLEKELKDDGPTKH